MRIGICMGDGTDNLADVVLINGLFGIVEVKRREYLAHSEGVLGQRR